MVLAVHLNLDQTASDRVRVIWWALAADGINDFMLAAEDVPHISLAIYVEADVDALRAAIGAEGVLFLAPKRTAGLLRLHQLFHQFAAAMRRACSLH